MDQTPLEPLSIDDPENPESATVDGMAGLVAAAAACVAAVGFFAAMLMAVFAGATTTNPAREGARFASAVAAGVVLALAGVIVGVVRGAKDTGGIGRTERRLRRRDSRAE
ncbi:MAG TPA: hypothetical protein VFJ82_08630 [Longimicrobium sp.]|nr:hypothetical protein [Longimicrobium sp.]